MTPDDPSSQGFNDRWEGILIHIEKEIFTGLSYDVPGWRCKKCGARIGSTGPPPSECFTCQDRRLGLK